MTHHTDHRTDFDSGSGNTPLKSLLIGGVAVIVAVLVFLFFRSTIGSEKEIGFNTHWAPIAAPMTAPSPAPRTDPAPSFAPPPASSPPPNPY
jgi:hypothetical protein